MARHPFRQDSPHSMIGRYRVDFGVLTVQGGLVGTPGTQVVQTSLHSVSMVYTCS
jgi:hypothetical protein